MLTLARTFAFSIAFALSTAAVAHAEELAPDTQATATDPSIRRHDGFYLRLEGGGLGFDTAQAHASPSLAHLDGTSKQGFILIGGTPLPGLVLGGGLRQGTSHGTFVHGRDDGFRFDAFTPGVGAFVDWYPSPTRGWHLGAYAGTGMTFVNGSTWTHAAEIDGALFAGYDAWIGEQWSLGIDATAFAATSSALADANGDSGYRFAPRSFQLGITLVYH